MRRPRWKASGWRLQPEVVWISPYNDPEVIAGQGTVGLEIEGQWGDAPGSGQAAVYVPVGGGGLAVGIGAALDGLRTAFASLASCLKPHHTAQLLPHGVDGRRR